MKLWQKIAAALVPTAFAAGVILNIGSPVTLTPLTLTNIPAYYNNFKDNTTGNIFQIAITKTEYDQISKNDFQPTYPNATWINAIGTTLFNTGTTTIQDGEVFYSNDKAIVKISGKPAAILDSSLIQNNILSTQGVDAINAIPVQ